MHHASCTMHYASCKRIKYIKKQHAHAGVTPPKHIPACCLVCFAAFFVIVALCKTSDFRTWSTVSALYMSIHCIHYIGINIDNDDYVEDLQD